MTALLALLLAVSPLAESRGPSPAGHPRTLQSEAAQPSSNPGELPLDKLLHASVSANLAFGFAALAHVAGMHPDHAIWLGAGLALAVGIAREALGNWDVADLGADVVGVVAGGVTAKLLVWRF